MDICICIFGQVRKRLDDLQALQDAFAGHNLTFVVNIWDKRGLSVKSAPGARIPFYIDDIVTVLAGPENYISGLLQEVYELSASYGNVHSNIDDVTASDFDFLPADNTHISIRREADLRAELRPYALPPSNNLRMWYMIDKANERRRELECARGKAFDLVVCARPDIRLAANMPDVLARILPGLEECTLYADHAFGSQVVGDQFFMARSATMNKATAYYRTFVLPKYCATVYVDPHHDPYMFYVRQGIELKMLPVVDSMTARLIRESAAVVAPEVDLATVLAATGPGVQRKHTDLAGLHELLTLYHEAMKLPSKAHARTEQLLVDLEKTVLPHTLHYGANWLRALLLHKMGKPLDALALYTAAMGPLKGKGALPPLYRYLLMKQGVSVARALKDVSLTALKSCSPPRGWENLAEILLHANQLQLARDLCICALEHAQTALLFERLIYSHIRLQGWQHVLSAAEDATAAGLYNEAMHRLVTKATTQLGDASDTNYAETLARFEGALR